MTEHAFAVEAGIDLHYTIDDFTDPWIKAPTLILEGEWDIPDVHAIAGAARHRG